MTPALASRTLIRLGPLLLLAGCASGHLGELRVRAATDLKCPESELRIESSDHDEVRWVSGCGRRLLYTRQCVPNKPCDWDLRDARSE